VQEPDESEHDTVDALCRPPAESVFSNTRSIQNEIASSREFSTVDVQRVTIDLVRLLHDGKTPDSDSSDSDSPDSDPSNSGSVNATEKLELTSELGRTLLHLSAALDFRELLRELVYHGVAFDHRDISGRTALHYAALYGRLECAKLLIHSGADVHVKDKSGCLAQELAIGSLYNDIGEVLKSMYTKSLSRVPSFNDPITSHTLSLPSLSSGTAVGEPLQGHSDWVTSVAFSPDGTRIASGSLDSTIRLWDAASGTAVGEPLQGHSDWVTSVAFSPDGTRIASGSLDSTIRLWDAASGTAIGEPL